MNINRQFGCFALVIAAIVLGWFYNALAAATGTAKTAQPVECEASQSGPEGATPNPLKDRDHD